MADSLMYHDDHYVLLTPDAPAAFCTPAELREKLAGFLAEMTELSPELTAYGTTAERVEYLLNTGCRLERSADDFIEWYVVRLEKPPMTPRR